MMNLRYYLGLLAVAIVAIFFYAWITNPLVVTVTGTATAAIPAEQALITLTTTELNPSPVIASQNLNTKVQTLRSTLIENGVPEDDLIQSQVRITPANVVNPNAQGFAATVTLGGPTTNIANVANLTATLYERGATLVSQPVLQNENQEELERNALNEAIKNAKSKASTIGAKHLKFIRRVGTIQQLETPTTGTFTSRRTTEAQEANDIATLDNYEITKVVQVTYRMW